MWSLYLELKRIYVKVDNLLRYVYIEEEKSKLESLLQVEHESKAKIEEEKTKEIEESFGTIESVRGKMEEERSRRIEAEKEVKKTRIEISSLTKQNAAYLTRIERLEKQLEGKASESQQQLCDRLNAIQDEMKKLQQQKVLVVSPGKVSVDCESVDYRITPERLLAAKARSKKSELAAIAEHQEDATAEQDIPDEMDYSFEESVETAQPPEEEEEEAPEAKAPAKAHARKPKRKAAPKRKTPPRKAKKSRPSPVQSSSKPKPVATRKSQRHKSPTKPENSKEVETTTRPKRQRKPTRKAQEAAMPEQKKASPEPKIDEADGEDESVVTEEEEETEVGADEVETEDAASNVADKASDNAASMEPPKADVENEGQASNVKEDIPEKTRKEALEPKAKPAKKVSKAAQKKKRKLLDRKQKFVGPSSFSFKFIDRKTAPKLKANVRK